MTIKTFIIDAFTNQPFKGNPAGVCLLDEPIDVSIMQSIANELNLSETAFLIQNQKNLNAFSIRFFSPTIEVTFCGHATLAASKLILDRLDQEKTTLTTHKGLVIDAVFDGEFIKMKFPLYETTAYQPKAELYEAFGINEPIATRFAADLEMLIIEVKDKKAVLEIEPNFQKAMESSDEIKEVVITSKSTEEEFDFYSRCFCPWIGINEDPVTGASHSVLAQYWGEILGKNEMSAYQLSKRGGFLKLKRLNAKELEVRSNARIVFEGIIQL